MQCECSNDSAASAGSGAVRTPVPPPRSIQTASFCFCNLAATAANMGRLPHRNLSRNLSSARAAVNLMPNLIRVGCSNAVKHADRNQTAAHGGFISAPQAPSRDRSMHVCYHYPTSWSNSRPSALDHQLWQVNWPCRSRLRYARDTLGGAVCRHVSLSHSSCGVRPHVRCYGQRLVRCCRYACSMC